MFREAPRIVASATKNTGGCIHVANRFRSDLREFTPRPSKSDDDPVSYPATSNERNGYHAVIPSFSLFADLIPLREYGFVFASNGTHCDHRGNEEISRVSRRRERMQRASHPVSVSTLQVLSFPRPLFSRCHSHVFSSDNERSVSAS